ncbi:MAG: class I SAM-dependent methyltransferase [Bacteriovoracia bacterium]
MTYSTDWEDRYREGAQKSLWPWSDLISAVMRHARPQNKEYRVLELGPGLGANIPFFESLGVDYWGLDGSESAVSAIAERFPKYAANIRQGDFSRPLPYETCFDAVIDRAAVTHNSRESILSIIREVHRVLKPGGKFVGIDWFSKSYSEFKKSSGTDPHTRKFNQGPFANLGLVHFSDQEDLNEIFKDFRFLLLEEKIMRREIPADSFVYASWNLVAEKVK